MADMKRRLSRLEHRAQTEAMIAAEAVRLAREHGLPEDEVLAEVREIVDYREAHGHWPPDVERALRRGHGE
jgi:hypothetical protein